MQRCWLLLLLVCGSNRISNASYCIRDERGNRSSSAGQSIQIGACPAHLGNNSKPTATTTIQATTTTRVRRTSARAAITLPSARRDVLIFLASAREVPVAPDLCCCGGLYCCCGGGLSCCRAPAHILRSRQIDKPNPSTRRALEPCHIGKVAAI